MNKYFPLVLLNLLGIITINAQVIEFEDPDLHWQLTETQTVDSDMDGIVDTIADTNQDNEIQVSEALAITGGLYLKAFAQTIESFAEIHFFSNIKYLNMANQNLTEIDLSQNLLLEEFDLSTNFLTTLNLTTNSALRVFRCEFNELSTITLGSKPELLDVFLSFNQLTTIEIGDCPSLERLYISFNTLSQINVQSNDNLVYLNLAGNELSEIDVINNLALVTLDVSYNPMATLDVSNNLNLFGLTFAYTPISTMDVSNNESLGAIYFEGTQMTSMDLSNNPNLTNIYCENSEFLEFVNLKNGNNTIIERMFSGNSPNLACIQVDDVEYANDQECIPFPNYGWCKDEQTTYSENCVLAVEEFKQEEVVLAPNPFLNTIGGQSLSEIKKIEFYDVQGRMVQLVEKDFEIMDLSHLNSGVFIARICTALGIQNKKIVKL